uniref:(northern house mosquito) hypothetical protein n=1 Tax=Culex pipiens TaxID=7175 RepID=A0A8D8F230_CULPI
MFAVEHVHVHRDRIGRRGRARILARVGGFRPLDQQIGRRDVTLLRYHRHAATWRIVVDFLAVVCPQDERRRFRQMTHDAGQVHRRPGVDVQIRTAHYRRDGLDYG